jgi:hypothetical protein
MRSLAVFVLLSAAAPAFGQDFQPPNSLVWGAVGTPWLVSGRGEAWLADQASVELGAGGLGPEADLGFDWAVRWRPDPLCINCGQRDLLTLGIGPGGLVVPSFDGGSWGLSVGADLGANYVHWLSPTLGLTISGRAGVGAGFLDLDVGNAEADFWAFGGAGLAF